MALFTPKSTSKLRSALLFRYLIVITRFIPCANTTNPNPNNYNPNNHYNHGFYMTFDYNHFIYSDYLLHVPSDS